MQRCSSEVALVDSERRRILRSAMIGMTALFFSACRDSAPNGTEGLLPGDRFPDVALPYLDGRAEPFAIPAAVPLLVNFWASWCEPCRREMPSLETLSGLFSSGDLMVIGVTVDSEVNLAREFSLQHRLTFPQLSDSHMALSTGILHIPAFPMTYLLKRDRTVARIYAGARNWSEPAVVEEIKGLLGIGN